jgi:tRNA (guanine37-N1)-methyltransferase
MPTLRDVLKGKLSEDELKLVPSAFDIIGNRDKSVAIIEFPDELVKHEREIAEAIMRLHKSVKSVLKKASPRTGVLRLREYRLIAGDKNTEVIHVESGCRLRLDPQKTYFSQRESAERLRIVEKIRAGETVMVFFAGAGPFAILAAKKTKAERVIGIEINPDAIRYFHENVRLNKLKNVEVMEGDVRERASTYYGQCDRILMPLPERAVEYVDEAIKCTKPGGIIHLYCFAKEEEIDGIEENIAAIASSLNRDAKFLGHELVLPWGPRIWKMRVDVKLTS